MDVMPGQAHRQYRHARVERLGTDGRRALGRSHPDLADDAAEFASFGNRPGLPSRTPCPTRVSWLSDRMSASNPARRFERVDTNSSGVRRRIQLAINLDSDML